MQCVTDIKGSLCLTFPLIQGSQYSRSIATSLRAISSTTVIAKQQLTNLEYIANHNRHLPLTLPMMQSITENLFRFLTFCLNFTVGHIAVSQLIHSAPTCQVNKGFFWQIGPKDLQSHCGGRTVPTGHTVHFAGGRVLRFCTPPCMALTRVLYV